MANERFGHGADLVGEFPDAATLDELHDEPGLQRSVGQVLAEEDRPHASAAEGGEESANSDRGRQRPEEGPTLPTL